MAECEIAQTQTSEVEADQELLRGLREASPRACSLLYRRYAPGLHRFANTRLAGDSALAEEIVLQTLMDAVRNIRAFNPRKATFSAWLFGIARHNLADELRRQRRRKSVPRAAQMSIEVLPEAPDQADLADRVSARLDAQRQFTALAEVLSAVELEALILQHIDQLSLQEIGQVLGRSERAVQSLLHRARSKARERLEQDER